MPENANQRKGAIEVLQYEAEINVAKLTVMQLLSDVREVSEELVEGYLDEMWSFDKDGNRIHPTPEFEAQRICEQLQHNPNLWPDVHRLLKKKLNKLKIESSRLEQELKTG